MNARTYIILETTKEDRTYVFSVPFGATYQEAFEVTQEFAAGVQEMAKQAEEAAKKAAEDKDAIIPEIVQKGKA